MFILFGQEFELLIKWSKSNFTANPNSAGGGNQPPSGQKIEPGQSIDHVLNHEVKELGTHILVCEVNYLAPSSGKMNFRKFFKFSVLKPLDVKTKFYNAENDDVFLEAQVLRMQFFFKALLTLR